HPGAQAEAGEHPEDAFVVDARAATASEEREPIVEGPDEARLPARARPEDLLERAHQTLHVLRRDLLAGALAEDALDRRLGLLEALAVASLRAGQLVPFAGLLAQIEGQGVAFLSGHIDA